VNAALEIARGSLDAAKAGIDTPGTMAEGEILELIATAQRLIDRTAQAARIEAVQTHAKAALEELDQLEQIRRLLAYGIAIGRTNKEGVKLHAILEARPTITKTSDINAASKAFEWLGAHRREISQLLANVNPSNQ
jgi:hypothetical protein